MSALQWVLVALVCGIMSWLLPVMVLWLALAALLTALGISRALAPAGTAIGLCRITLAPSFWPLALKFLETRIPPAM